MSNQRDVFLRTEGDEWYRRNLASLEPADDDVVIRAIEFLGLEIGSVLEARVRERSSIGEAQDPDGMRGVRPRPVGPGH